MKVRLVVELEMADLRTDEAFDTWSWALERQIETLDTVHKADVVDFTVQPEPRRLWPDEPPQDQLETRE
jgi:hypothetical protein